MRAYSTVVPPDTRGPRGSRGDGPCDVLLLHHCPQKPDQLPRHRHHRDLRLGAERELAIERVQAVLRLPRMRDHDRRLAALPRGEGRADLRLEPIRPGGLDEHVAAPALVREPRRSRSPEERSLGTSPR